MSTAFAPRPQVSYLDCVWRALQKLGWHLSHWSLRDEGTGEQRHLVRARKEDADIICSGPTLDQAISVLFVETRSGKRGGRVLTTN